ncbi:ABC-F family ATP-binding cassette domain-containing protein [Avrilella dinanensis]|uniref:Probable ATP-binding protein YbiT n=1 Tax=Avrilella dinanensis TaxID=2008672 RepID=A0A2M9R601_9FLAO|nr:ABC-F family ATP-binding cassette domain-containing protein [Avrilella dinanensis]PJR04270.1 glycosyl transferase family 2 [Avrilella dinanensis]
MLNIHNLTVSFSGENLFEGITFRLNAGDRVGLIGKNGAGKSTMLKVLSGEIAPDGGSIATEKNLRIGFLKQDLDFESGKTVLEESYQAFTEIKSIESQLDKINNELATRTDYESESYNDLIEKLSELTHQYDILGGYNYQGQAEKVLLGLGFKPEDFDRYTETFSGGWRMRIELAKLLLQNNDVLLLDEPTNHLDIESILWLEGFLNNFPGAVVLVSHDKTFLDNVTNRTIEISLGKIYDYNKPYSQYLVLREEVRTNQLAAQKNQAKMIEDTEKLINKFRAKANKASMAQSLIKKLDKIERIEVDEEDNAVMNISFPISVNPGKVVLEIENFTKAFDDKIILQNLNLNIERGDKVAFVGQNGEGKSTLIKGVLNEFDYQGTIKPGHNVQIGYFAQNQADYLDGEKTIVDTMIDAADDSNRAKVRDMLGAFLFRGDDVEKKVKVLSGGERNRLALCLMLLKPINVLLMDEPTNHLDIASKNVLKKALKKFEGTLVIVSHDRDFLEGLTDKVYEFKNRTIKEYLGDINYFLEERKMADMRAFESEQKNRQKLKEQPTGEKKTKMSYEQQKALKSLQNKLSKLETQISDLEKKIEKSDKELAQNYETLMNDTQWFSKYEKQKNELEQAMTDWGNVQEELDRQ